MRLIDANSLMKTVFNDVVLVDGEVKGVGLILAETVDKAPTVDAVHVVRCRDCQKFKTYGCRMVASGYDDFCSYGERKDIDNAT